MGSEMCIRDSHSVTACYGGEGGDQGGDKVEQGAAVARATQMRHGNEIAAKAAIVRGGGECESKSARLLRLSAVLLPSGQCLGTH